MNLPTDFSGRIALVTGAGRGIGCATVKLLQERGATIMAVARTEQELINLKVPYIVADLSVETVCHEAVAQTIEQLGGLDILIANHGLGSAHEVALWNQTSETWNESVTTNLDSSFYLTQAAMSHMVDKGYGRIVYTSSTAAIIPEKSGSAYNSSKAGLVGLMRSAAIDGGLYGVTANAVLPGWVKTEMAEKSALAEAKKSNRSVEEVWNEREELYPANRVVDPIEVAELISFLSSESSSGVSGEAIRVALGGVL